MKQRFLLSLLFVCSLVVTTRAQINKGATWLGGQAGYSQSSDKGVSSAVTNKQTSFNISPAIGTAVKDNLIVGIFATYQNYRSKSIMFMAVVFLFASIFLSLTACIYLAMQEHSLILIAPPVPKQRSKAGMPASAPPLVYRMPLQKVFKLKQG
jgi:hypothetical protein